MRRLNNDPTEPTETSVKDYLDCQSEEIFLILKNNLPIIAAYASKYGLLDYLEEAIELEHRELMNESF